MQTQTQWIDIYKKAACIRTDYALAKKWQTTTSRISQLRRDRQRLSLAECLEMAETIGIDPLEILTAIEYRRARPHEKACLKNCYFDALLKTIGQRMTIASSGSYHRRRRRR